MKTYPKTSEVSEDFGSLWDAKSGRSRGGPSRLDFGVRLPQEREAPAEPRLRVGVSPGSRLSRSFALPAGLTQRQIDETLALRELYLNNREGRSHRCVRPAC